MPINEKWVDYHRDYSRVRVTLLQQIFTQIQTSRRKNIQVIVKKY